MKYTKGRYSKAMCPIGGHKVKYTQLKRRWDGLWTSPEEWDRKHEQLDPIRNVFDPQALHHPWPDRDDDTGTPTATNPDSGKSLEDKLTEKGMAPTFGGA